MGREFVLQLSGWEKFDEIWVIARRADRLEELAQVVPQSAAEAVWQYYHKEETQP